MQRQNRKVLFANCASLIAVGIIAVGCTSTRVDDISASSSHKSIADDQTVSTAQIEAIQPQEPNLPGVNGYTNDQQVPLPTASTTTNGAVTRSGVIYQDQTQTRSLAQPAINSNSVQVQQASLGTYPQALRTDPNAPQTMEFVDPNSPESLAQQRIDLLYPSMEHATCKDGWATPPDQLDAKRTVEGHPYYMEMRLRNTPLLPVGHTYIAYGRLSPEGELLNEHVVMLSPFGGYGGAAVAAAIPMPGILKPVADDCRIKPHAAYRVSLTAEQFEQLLLRIKKAQQKIPAYALFAYNCNHFASDIAASVGILPPKNIYLPAVKYIYGVIEANEGFNPKKSRRG